MNHYFYDFELYQSPPEVNAEENLVGKNAKKLLVVIEESDFSEENKHFLSKILSAVDYDMLSDASTLVVPASSSVSANQLMNSNRYDRCLIFGINPKDLGFSIESFLYAPFDLGSKAYVIGHRLEKIKNSTEYKKALWAALKALFMVDT